MTRQMRKMLIIVGVVFGLIFAWYAFKKIFFSYMMSHYKPPAVTISATQAKVATWQDYLTAVGNIVAVNGTDISSEASGIIKTISFQSGQNVKQGDPLFLLDTSVEQADLKSAEAKLALAQINQNRNTTLLNKKVIPQSSSDTTAAELKEAQAALESAQARIKQKTITAPFSGRIGICQVNEGQYVAAGTAFVSLQSLDPLYVDFDLPEQYLNDLFLQQKIEISIETSNGSKKFQGQVTAINSKVSQETRNITVEATIPNKELQLYPGMFAMVKIWLKAQNNVVTIPQTAIAYSLHGDSVYVIKPDPKEKNKDGTAILHANRVYVKAGERREDEVAILEGVKAGEQVVTSGQLKLQNGTSVDINNSAER